jgi:small subunit ribosomal protein S16
MLRIKLSRGGKKKQPIYRILVMERARDPWGTFLENVGTYNPRTNPSTVNLKEDRIKHWISKGAQPTDTVHNLLVEAGVIEGKKINNSKLGKKAKEAIKKEAEEAKEKALAEKEAAEAPAPADKPKEEAPAEDAAPAEEAPKEEAKPEEKPADAEAKADAPTEEEKKSGEAGSGPAGEEAAE